MDRFSAHMDRSWDLIMKGQVTHALAAARQALELSRTSPEVHNLLGYIHALGGDFEDAVEHYHQAMELDEWYLDPMLNAAELLVHPEADPEEAIRLCRRAAQLELSQEERVDVLLIEVDALLNLGRYEEARERIAQLEDPLSLSPMYQSSVGRALYDLGDFAAASGFLEAAVEGDKNIPEAWYCRGLIAREEGRRIDAVASFLETQRLDIELPRLPWGVEHTRLLDLVRRIVDGLPEELGDMISDAEITVMDYPSREQIIEEVDPRKVVLAHGIDPEKGRFSGLTVFSMNLERIVSPVNLEDGLIRAITYELTGDRGLARNEH